MKRHDIDPIPGVPAQLIEAINDRFGQVPGQPTLRIQQGAVTIPNGASTATQSIEQVDTSRAFLVYLGSTGPLTIRLSNSKAVTATRVGTTGDVTASFSVIELT